MVLLSWGGGGLMEAYTFRAVLVIEILAVPTSRLKRIIAM
jgi:hypothetical protein